ncbi:MAG: protease inhibitor I42 family protein [Burkholderiaceae bacterium]
MLIGLKRKWAAVGAAVLLLAACSAAPPSQRPEPRVDAFGVHVSDEHSGGSVTLEREQKLVVSLPTVLSQNREWELVGFVPGVLTGSTVPAFERDPIAAHSGDASGNSVWHFKPGNAGTVTLTFDYRNPRTREPVSRTVSYTVTVR